MIWNAPSKSTRSAGRPAVSMLAPTLAPTQAAYDFSTGRPLSGIAGLLPKDDRATRRTRGEGHECNQHLCRSPDRSVRFFDAYGAATGRLEPRRPYRDWNNDRAHCFVRRPASFRRNSSCRTGCPLMVRRACGAPQDEADVPSALSAGARHRSPVTKHRSKTVNRLVNVLTRLGLLTEDLDYHLIRASMVLIFLAFGY